MLGGAIDQSRATRDHPGMGNAVIERQCSRCALVTKHEIRPGVPAECVRCRDLDAEVRERMALRDREAEVHRRAAIADYERREAMMPKWEKMVVAAAPVVVICFFVVIMFLSGKWEPLAALDWLLR